MKYESWLMYLHILNVREIPFYVVSIVHCLLQGHHYVMTTSNCNAFFTIYVIQPALSYR